MTAPTVAGVDGCKGGWIAVIARPDQPLQARVFAGFADLLDALPETAIVAVDMPIGLPDVTRHGGRGPETLGRRLLGERQSSVFSIPSRAAVYADESAFVSIEAWYEAHRRSSEVARKTSDPPRGVSIQAFGIFPKIREIDGLLRAHPQLRARLFESHPEVAFWQLNGERAMRLPKKIRNRVNPAGIEERKALLARCSVPREFLELPPPRGANVDDLVDATAMCLVARRIATGQARSFPDPPAADSFGIPIAIWC